jgi:hypothetical protein
MSTQRPKAKGGGHERRISVRGVRRAEPDLKKLSQALIALAIAEEERAAQAEHEHKQPDGEARHA